MTCCCAYCQYFVAAVRGRPQHHRAASSKRTVLQEQPLEEQLKQLSELAGPQLAAQQSEPIFVKDTTGAVVLLTEAAHPDKSALVTNHGYSTGIAHPNESRRRLYSTGADSCCPASTSWSISLLVTRCSPPVHRLHIKLCHSCSCCACMDAEASDVSQAVRQQPSKSSGKVKQSALRAWQALAAEATYQSASARQLAGMLHSIRTVHSVPTCTM